MYGEGSRCRRAEAGLAHRFLRAGVRSAQVMEGSVYSNFLLSSNKCLPSSNKKLLGIRNKCIATSNKCLTSSNKKLLGTSASLLVTRALLVLTRSYSFLVSWRFQLLNFL